MPFTRRQFVLYGTVLFPGLAGCSDSLAAESLQEVQLVLSNRTDGAQTLHVVLEAEDGLGEWHDFSLEAGASRQATIDPPAGREWIGYHAVSGATQTSGSVFGQGDETTCLQLEFRIRDDEVVVLLSTSKPLC